MPEDRYRNLNNYTELSTSSPKKTQPTEQQMGLGHPLSSFAKPKNNNKNNTSNT